MRPKGDKRWRRELKLYHELLAASEDESRSVQSLVSA